MQTKSFRKAFNLKATEYKNTKWQNVEMYYKK